MICSATKPKPKGERTLNGKSGQAWFCSERFSKITRILIQEAEDKWEEFMEE